MARLKDMYSKEVAPALMNKFAYKSPMQIPRFDKIVINIGAGDAKENAKVIDTIIADLTLIMPEKGFRAETFAWKGTEKRRSAKRRKTRKRQKVFW